MHLLVLHALGLRLRAPPPRCQAAAAASTEDPVVVIGSGIGGLSCAAMLARYGRSVTVLESHVHAGGCAHSFERRTKEGTFVFDSGPSLWSGMSSPSVNPLRQVLDVVDESDNIDWIAYNGWGMIIPEGEFFFKVGDEESWLQTLREFGGPDAEAQWARLRGACDPVTAASGATPPMVLRSDPWVALSVLRCFGGIMQAAPHAAKLNGPFSLVMDQAALSDPFIRGWLDYLAFALSGLDAAGTLGAAVAFTMGDLYRRGATLDYPVGGAGAVIDALVRGIEKHDGCSVRLGAHVERIELDADGRASGVVLRGGERLGASAVVSNADAWATLRLLPEAARPAERPGGGGALNAALEKTPSFMHLHLGFRGGDGAGEEPLPDGLGIHYSVVLDSFSDICRDNNMVIISIPTLLDPSLAPDGHHVLRAYYAPSSLPPLAPPRILRRRRPPAHSGVPRPSLPLQVLHAYYAADEPYEVWAGLDRKSDEYAALKVERAKPLWAAVEKVIPDIRSRLVVEMVASPLTHERYLRRTAGTYGPALFSQKAGETIPYAKTQVPGLLHCGDSCFPGIGVPSAAASGMNAANTLATPWEHLAMLQEVEDTQARLRGGS